LNIKGSIDDGKNDENSEKDGKNEIIGRNRMICEGDDKSLFFSFFFGFSLLVLIFQVK